MMTLARRAWDKHLGDDAGIPTPARLEAALTALMLDLGPTLIGSFEYAAAFALVAQRRWQGESFTDDVETGAMESLLADRFAHYAKASHFSALTILLAFTEQPDPAHADPVQVRHIMTTGVQAFIRAYAPAAADSEGRAAHGEGRAAHGEGRPANSEVRPAGSEGRAADSEVCAAHSKV
jgi:TetR/AcrR family transcriptional regulator, mexJK operon transcriptional repressor